MKSYKFRVYPTPKQAQILVGTLVSCQRLYNTALEHRITVYKSIGKNISYMEQQKELPELKQMFPQYKSIHSQVVQNVLYRVDLAFKSFFRRAKIKGQKAGFPRFKSKDRYDSFCFPQSGFYIKGSRVDLSKIGLLKVKFHRNIPDGSDIKTCTIKRDGKAWYVIFICDIHNIVIKKKTVVSSVGIDLGLTDFAVLSDGTKIKNPKYLKQSEGILKETQIRYSKGKSKKVKRKLIRLYRKVSNQRNDFHHKLSHSLVNRFDFIAHEDLKIKEMIEDSKYNLQKSISDAGWGAFISMLKYKAEKAGTTIIAVNPKGTTQRCSNCDTIVPKSLHVRLHNCTVCGFTASRDYNAALNIHKLGINLVDNHNILCLSAESTALNG